MAWEYVVPADDREAFLGCRRAWDLGAEERGNREPREPPEPDLDHALRAALAVYYFPGMWDWQPHMVLRLVRTAFLDALGRMATDVELNLLEAYFHWAPEVDDMAPVLVSTEVDVQVPDPARPDRDVVATDGRAVRYRDRFDLLAIDAEHRYWMMRHRLVHGPWPPVEQLRLEERCLSWCWAFEQAYPGIRIEGTMFNELRTDLELEGRGPAQPERRGSVPQTGGAAYIRPWSKAQDAVLPPPADPWAGRPAPPVVYSREAFRRVLLPRGRAEIGGFAERLAAQLREMVDPAVHCYPSPAAERCARCAFRAPCLTLNAGGDPSGQLDAEYQARSNEPAPGQLGRGTWSVGRSAAPPGLGQPNRPHPR